MAACETDLISNVEVSGTTPTLIGSARILTGSNNYVSFRAMMGTTTAATSSLQVKRFTGGTLIDPATLTTTGTGLNDVSGSQITIADNAAITGSWAPGKVNTYSLEFEASDTNRVSIPLGATSGSSNGESGSIAAWIYRDAAGSYPMILATSKGSVTTDYSYFAIWTGGAYLNKLVWQIYQGGAEVSSCYSAGTISEDVWTHVAVTCDGTNTKFYINATASTTTVGGGADGKWYADGDANTTVAHIGNLDYGSGVPGYSYPFPGKLDEIAVWTEPLNLGGVKALYNDGSGAKANTVSSSYLASYYDMELRGPGSCQLLDITDNDYDGTLEDMDCGKSKFMDDWYDFYVSGSDANGSTLVKGIKVTLY